MRSKWLQKILISQIKQKSDSLQYTVSVTSFSCYEKKRKQKAKKQNEKSVIGQMFLTYDS